MNKRRLFRFGPSALLTALFLALAPSAMACSVCFGDPSSPMSKGVNNAIIFLLGVVGFVQIGFVALFWSWWRNGLKLKKKREALHLIPGGVR